MVLQGLSFVWEGHAVPLYLKEDMVVLQGAETGCLGSTATKP